MSILTVENISKAYDSHQVLKNVNLAMNSGEVVSILGLSGAGKSTLFNIISGLEKADSGKVYLNGSDITGTSGHVSYMLQKDLLFPFYTILDNVSLPLVIRGTKKAEARQKAAAYFEQFGLKGTENQRPSELSGGMRQRAALLRTYLFSKEVMLLDEPFSALDMITKTQMHTWYLEMVKKLKLSTLFITHDIDEAIMISDRICILGCGENAAGKSDDTAEKNESAAKKSAAGTAKAAKAAGAFIQKEFTISRPEDSKGTDFMFTKEFLLLKQQIFKELKL